MALNAGELTATFSLDLASLDRSVRTAEKTLGGIGKTIGGLGLTAMLTRPVLDAAGEIFSFGQEFEAQMDRVGAVLNLEGMGLGAEEAAEQMARLRDCALEMGETTSLSARRAAEAMEALAMAGWGTQDIEQAIEPLIRLSEVSGTGNLQETASIVADTLTALGAGAGEAGRLADVLTAAATGSNTDLEKLGTTFKYVASMAGTLGFSMEDLALASGIMANAGIKAQKAGTGLRAVLNRMSSNGKAQRAMEDLGISLYDAQGKARSLRDVMVDLRGAFQGLTEEERTQAAYLLGGTSGMNAVLAIAGASEESFRTLADAIDQSGGTAVRTASRMLDNLKGDLTLLDSALGTTKILLAGTFEEAGRKGVQKLTGLVQAFNGLGEEGQGAALKLAGLAAAAGPLAAALGALETASAVLLPSVLALVSPAGLLTAGLAGLGAAAVSTEGDLGRLLEAAGKKGAEKLRQLEEQIPALTERIRTELPGVLEGMASSLSSLLPSFLSLLTAGAEAVMETLASHMEEIAALPEAVISALAEGLTEHAEGIVHAGASLISALASGVISSLPVLLSGALTVAESFGKAILETDWGALALRVMESLGRALHDAGRLLSSALGDFMQSAFPAESLLEGLGGIGEAAGLGVQEAMDAALSAIKGGFDALGSWLSGDGPRAILGGMEKIGSEMAGAAGTAFSLGLSALSDILSAALGALSEIPLTDILAAMGRLAGDIASELGKALRIAVTASIDLAGALGNALRNIDWREAGGALGEAAVNLIGELARSLAGADMGSLIAALGDGIAAAASSVTALAGGILEQLAAGLADPGNLEKLAASGVEIIRSLARGVLSAAGSLADALVSGLGNLLGPALSRLLGGTFESRTQEIDVFRHTVFRVDPALFDQAEKTGREVESMLSRLLVPGGIASSRDLQQVTAVYDLLLREGQEGMIRLTHGLARYGNTGFTDLFGSILTTLEGGGGSAERAGQEAALLYMAGFGETVQSAAASAGLPEIREKVMDAMEEALRGGAWEDERGYIDVEAAARSLSLDLNSILGFSIPEGYRLAFNGMETELVRLTEDGFAAVARSASFEGLFDGADIWREVEGTTLSGLGDMAETLGSALEGMGVSAGALLGKKLSEETVSALRASLENGDASGAAADLIAMLGLEEAGEAIRLELAGAAGEAAGLGGEIAAAADPGPAMTEVFSRAGEDAAASAVSALDGAVPEVQSAAWGFSEAAVLAFEEKMTGEEGGRIALAFAQGAVDTMREEAGASAEAASALGEAAASALSSALSPSLAASAGARFGEGLAQGLRSALASVAGAAGSLASAASGSVRSAWAIHSPSRVAEEMGEMYVAGLVKGLSGADQVRRAALSLSSGAEVGGVQTESAAQVRTLLSSLTRLTPPAQEARSTPERTEEHRASDTETARLIASALSGLVIQMDGRAVGETVAPAISQIMAEGARERRFGG